MRTLALVLTLAVAAAAAAQKNEPFVSECDFPFEAAARDIDDDCGIEGSAGTNAKRTAASRAKNNFCADNAPIAVTFAVLDHLQRRANAEEIPTGPNRFPEDRGDLEDITTVGGKKLGEGERVRLVAWVMKAKYSNATGKGEHVNCSRAGKERNDIHIALAKNKNDAECTTVTAEMSPHGRPEEWAPENLLNLQFPVRVTGQLYYDSVHAPCEPGKVRHPKRRSSWEIHPVYTVDVCRKKSLAKCPVNGGASVWISLTQFLEEEAEEDAHEEEEEEGP